MYSPVRAPPVVVAATFVTKASSLYESPIATPATIHRACVGHMVVSLAALPAGVEAAHVSHAPAGATALSAAAPVVFGSAAMEISLAEPDTTSPGPARMLRRLMTLPSLFEKTPCPPPILAQVAVLLMTTLPAAVAIEMPPVPAVRLLNCKAPSGAVCPAYMAALPALRLLAVMVDETTIESVPPESAMLIPKPGVRLLNAKYGFGRPVFAFPE
jgi:hypothetical protein